MTYRAIVVVAYPHVPTWITSGWPTILSGTLAIIAQKPVPVNIGAKLDADSDYKLRYLTVNLTD